MPSLAEHLAEARYDERMASYILDTFPNWSIVALFYSALHLVEGYFYADRASGDPWHYVDHRERSRAVVDRLPAVAREHASLYTASVQARYLCIRFTLTDVALVRRQYYDPLRARLSH